MMIIKHALNPDQLSQLLSIEKSALLQLCKKMETFGYSFQKTYDGSIRFTDKDIAVILCLS